MFKIIGAIAACLIAGSAMADTGKVKFFNQTKGFGAIVPDPGQPGGNAELFVHVSSLKDQVTEGDRVEYNRNQDKKGPSAINVKRIGR